MTFRSRVWLAISGEVASSQDLREDRLAMPGHTSSDLVTVSSGCVQYTAEHIGWPCRGTQTVSSGCVQYTAEHIGWPCRGTHAWITCRSRGWVHNLWRGGLEPASYTAEHSMAMPGTHTSRSRRWVLNLWRGRPVASSQDHTLQSIGWPCSGTQASIT